MKINTLLLDCLAPAFAGLAILLLAPKPLLAQSGNISDATGPNIAELLPPATESDICSVGSDSPESPDSLGSGGSSKGNFAGETGFSVDSQIVRNQLLEGSEKKEILAALGGGTDAENLASSLQGILVYASEAGWQVNVDKLERAIDNYNSLIEESPQEFLVAPPMMLIAIRDELMLWKKMVENN
ncbi:MAG: hypothetical protein F6J93_14310 [Oscillatoria sp. SIO1A7]|nr:hypothetical protein [Oscillatoria sp. SIO1A7]